jgi:hypothetical protein
MQMCVRARAAGSCIGMYANKCMHVWRVSAINIQTAWRPPPLVQGKNNFVEQLSRGVTNCNEFAERRERFLVASSRQATQGMTLCHVHCHARAAFAPCSLLNVCVEGRFDV